MYFILCSSGHFDLPVVYLPLLFSYTCVQARSATIGQVLMGYVTIPSTVDQPLDLVVNPQGAATRSRPRVWNRGDKRTKLISLARILPIEQQELREARHAGLSGLPVPTAQSSAPVQ